MENGKLIYELKGKKFYFDTKEGLQLDQYTQMQSIISLVMEKYMTEKLHILKLVDFVFSSKYLHEALATLLIPENEKEWDISFVEETKKYVGKMKDPQIVELLTYFFVGRISLMDEIRTSLDNFKKKKNELAESQQV